jgi:cytoskeletal protein RodZ
MQTIGERLEEARKKKGISLREAADATKIRGDYLQRFETNQFNLKLNPIYVKGFLKSYALYLELPADRIVEEYIALAGADTRPKQPSREVYGRMDLSVASPDADPANVTAPPVTPSETKSTETRVPRYPRHSPSGLPPKQSINPNLVFKGGIALVAVLIVVVILWIARSLFEPTVPPKVHTVQPVVHYTSDQNFKLIALANVQVRVTTAAGQIVFEGSLIKGQTQTIPWTAKVTIQASSGDNLALEVRGKRYAMPYKSGTQNVSSQAQLPAP